MSKKKDFFEQVKRHLAYAESRTQEVYQEHILAWKYHDRLLPGDFEKHLDKDGKEIPNVGDIPHEYVEPVMHTVVTQLASQFKNLFANQASEAVKFTDTSMQANSELADMINQHVNQVYLRLNDGQLITEIAAKDALISPSGGWAKTFIEPHIKKDTVIIDDWRSFEDVLEEISQDKYDFDLPDDWLAEGKKSGEVDGMQWRFKSVPNETVPEQEQLAPLPETTQLQVKGTIPIIQNLKEIPIENVSLKDLIIDPSCGENIEETPFIAQRHYMPIGDLMEMGFSKSKLLNASTLDRSEGQVDKEALPTQQQFSGAIDYGFDSGDDLMRKVMAYECYIKSSIPNGGKRIALYQTWITDTEMLGNPVEVDFHPFVDGRIDITPDALWQQSLFRVCKPYQDEKSRQHRYADKNMMNAAFNRTLVTAKEYHPESLQQSMRPGAVIVQKSAGAVQPYPFVELPQSFGVLMEATDKSQQQSVGSLMGVMSGEDGLQQNVTAAAVNAVIGQEALKSKLLAGVFARTFVVPLFDKIYRTCKLEGMKFTLSDGTEITSDQWPEHYEWKISIDTPADEIAQQQQLMIVANFVSQTPRNAVMTDQNVYAIATRALKPVGVNAAEFFSNPANAPAPTQDQIDMQAAQRDTVLLNNQEIAAKVQLAVAQTAKAEAETQELVLKGQVERETMIHDALAKSAQAEAKGQQVKVDAVDKAGKLALDERAIDLEERKHVDVAIPTAQHQIRTQPNGAKPL